uniref:Kinesin-like protein n=2 Tax=Hirondellea gigas TaxID=1518452 RepID=A0A6A7G187_9CRUS
MNSVGSQEQRSKKIVAKQMPSQRSGASPPMRSEPPSESRATSKKRRAQSKISKPPIRSRGGIVRVGSLQDFSLRRKFNPDDFGELRKISPRTVSRTENANEEGLKAEISSPTQSEQLQGKDSNHPPEISVQNGVPMQKLARKSNISVCVRKRPMNQQELRQNEVDITDVFPTEHSILINEPRVKVDLTKYTECHEFVFDYVYSERSTNEQIYEDTTHPLVNVIFEKGHATCFAYGQTGTGKTYTMLGCSAKQPGIYVLAGRDIYKMMIRPEFRNLSVYVSFFEIYGGKLYDLLNGRRKLCPREDARGKVVITGLQERKCDQLENLTNLIEYGNNIRSTGQTGANIDSSRSHAVLRISLKTDQQKLHGRFSFIDLAGSERGADTIQQDRRTRLEGAEINKSLLALKECIRALDQDHVHLPFRGSKLTQVLKESFMGNSRTVMIANISPSSKCCEHTLNTLRYADRVKELKKDKDSPGVRKNAYMPHLPNQPSTKSRDESKRIKPSTDEEPGRIISPRSQEEERVQSEMIATHSHLVEELIKEEETISKSHKKHIDLTLKLAKEDMELLKRFDKLECSVDEYVNQLDDILTRKLDSIIDLKDKVSVFRGTLNAEERLSQDFSEFKKQSCNKM